MTRISQKNNIILCLLLLSLLFVMVTGEIFAQEITVKSKGSKSMNYKKVSFFQLLEHLKGAMPLTKGKIESILALPLIERKKTNSTIFLTAENITLADQIIIANLDLRTSIETEESVFLALNLSNSCINLQEIKSHYPSLQLMSLPRGRSMDEETSYSTDFHGGKLSFGFKESNAACLSSVVFVTKD